MSSVIETPEVETPGTGVETPDLAMTVHEVSASRMLSLVRETVKNIRGYGFTSLKHRQRMTAANTVPTSFMLSAAVALDASAKLREMAEATGDEIRDAVNFCNAYGPTADEVILRATGVQQTVRSSRDEAARKALRVYKAARGLNLPSDKDVLVPHIANMKRLLARGRKKGATSPDEPAAPVAAEPAKRS